MPPKSAAAAAAANGKGYGNRGDKKGDVKPKKISAVQLAMNKAVETADKLYKQHERERVMMENNDRLARQDALLDTAMERERLRADKEEYEKFVGELVEREQLAYKECEKHRIWSRIPEASRLPQVRSESSINTFLGVWRDKEEEYAKYKPPVVVIARQATLGSGPFVQRFLNGELGILPAERRKMVEWDLNQCVEAYQLTEQIRLEADRSLMLQNKRELEFFSESNGKVYEQVMSALDFVTIHSLLGYDVILEGPDNEFLTLKTPATNPVVKFGLWVKVKETTRSFASMIFPNIAMRLDPKTTSMPKLPKALGLSKENVAVRIIQLGFNPHSHHSSAGYEFYALNCVVKIDLLSFTERPKQSGDWLYRTETREAHKLHVVPYPPLLLENADEDLTLRVSFDVPNTIVMRQPMLLIGKWIDETKEWEPCSHTVISSESSAPDDRRCTFATAEFATFAILQEKGFDMPYENWRLQSESADEVLMVLEGRRRGEVSDREFRIRIQDAQCKLVAPDDPELSSLRESWLEPATLVRLLSQAGFNFALENADVQFLENIVPRSSELETKVYADIAQFCLFYNIASSRHNKYVEDADMALFRVSCQSRTPDMDGPLDVQVHDESKWHSVRYQTQRCAFAAFKEGDEVPDLRVVEGSETHLNLYALLLHEKGEEVRLQAVHETNFLLRRCIFQLLCLVRPLTCG